MTLGRAAHAAFGRRVRFPVVTMGKDVKLIGIRRMAIGRNTVIGSGSWLNVNRIDGANIALHIGENCFIGQDNFVSVGAAVTLRDYCLTTRYCDFLGSAHVYADPCQPYLKTGTTDKDSIYVGVNCFFGLGTRVMGNVRIGHGCVIGAGAEVRADIPPFSLVVGNPARVLRRFDFGKREWVNWPAADYVEGPAEDVYLETLRQAHRWVIHPLSAALRGGRDVM
jgi:acetyltransferase-like isoleucine patch superfamily enzyme